MNDAHRAALAGIITDIIEREAPVVDSDGVFPRAGITALGRAGLLGLMVVPSTLSAYVAISAWRLDR